MSEPRELSKSARKLHDKNQKLLADTWEFLREGSAMLQLGIPPFEEVFLGEDEELPAFPTAPTKVVGGKIIKPSAPLLKLSEEKRISRARLLKKVVVEEENGERACLALPASTIFLECYLPRGREMFDYQNFGGHQDRSITVTRGWWYTASHFEPAMGESVSQLLCGDGGEKVGIFIFLPENHQLQKGKVFLF